MLRGDAHGSDWPCVLDLGEFGDHGSTPPSLPGFPRAQRYGMLFSPEGGIATKWASLRRTTRTVCRNESRSGSSSAINPASCMNPRTAKCVGRADHLDPLAECVPKR